MKKSGRYLFETRVKWAEDTNGYLHSRAITTPVKVTSPKKTNEKNGSMWAPEHLLIGAVSSGVMTTFLFYAKQNSHYLNALKIDVLRGTHTYPSSSSSSVNWHNYSAGNFPFSFRQQPGCHNSLGLLKFDFENPFHVYLHDTNNKTAFLSAKRFFSHGCIRVEKPVDLSLALGIHPEQINMDSCLSGMKPQIIPLKNPMPVFVIYATVDIANAELGWFEDAYHKREK